MTQWIGLTGGIGSGKSQVAAEFVKLGVPSLDADAVSRKLTSENGKALPAIRALFGDKVFDEQSLNRAALRDLVFRRPQDKKRLEEVMFPLILDEMRTCQKQYPQAVYGIAEIPLLVENPLFGALVDRVLAVDVDETVQIGRVRKRSGLAEEEIRRIIRSQADRRDRLLHADDVLQNDGTPSELAEKVGRLHRFYLNAWGKSPNR